MSQSVSGDPLNLDAIEQSDLVLVCNMIPALVAEVRALRASLAEQDDNTPSAQRSADYWLRQTQRAEAERDHARAELADLRQAVESALDEHEPAGPVITGVPPSCPSCRVYAPCETERVLRAALLGPQEPGASQ